MFILKNPVQFLGTTSVGLKLAPLQKGKTMTNRLLFASLLLAALPLSGEQPELPQPAFYGTCHTQTTIDDEHLIHNLICEGVAEKGILSGPPMVTLGCSSKKRRFFVHLNSGKLTRLDDDDFAVYYQFDRGAVYRDEWDRKSNGAGSKRRSVASPSCALQDENM